MNGFERNRQSVEALFSSRKIKSGFYEEIIAESKDGRYYIAKDNKTRDYYLVWDGVVDRAISFDSPYVDSVLKGWKDLYEMHEFNIQSSRRPIKSGWVFIFGTDKAAVYENDNADTYKVECRNGCTFIDEYFDDEQDAREFAIEVSEDLSQSIRPIKSGKRKSYPEKALEELEEYFDRSADGWTIYTHKLTPEDEIIIGNVCDKYNCDFALGTSHVSIYEM